MFSLSLHSGGVGRRHFKSEQIGTSLVVQWLRLCAPNAGGLVSIPGQGTRSHLQQLRVHMPQLKTLHAATKTPVQPNKKTKIKKMNLNESVYPQMPCLMPLF